jgi:predicted MFS family arabinose efflux permease
VAAALVVGGWGANQFTPLSVVYRMDAGWSTLTVVGMFTVYLLGLVPALLLGIRAADRFGRRRLVRGALALTAVGSLVLAGAVRYEAAVYLSRLATGVAAGVIVSVTAAWLQDLSRSDDPGSGTRRAVYATGAGFAFGPVAAGAMAEWLPHPMVVPCLVHGTLALLVLAATTRVPDPATGGAPSPRAVRADRWSAVMHPRFVGVVLPASPAIFAAVTVAYVVLPPLVVDRVRDFAPLFSGLVAAVTLSVGLAVQPLAARIDRPGTARATLVAMATVVVGLLVGAVAVAQVSPVLVVAAAVLLGAGYGLTLESGLTEIGRLASPSALPMASALFQGVAHSGFLAPLLLAVSAGSASYPALLAGLALVGLVFLAGAATWSHLNRYPELTDRPRPGAPSQVGTEERSRPWGE